MSKRVMPKQVYQPPKSKKYKQKEIYLPAHWFVKPGVICWERMLKVRLKI